MRAVMFLSALMAAIWASLIALMYSVEALIMQWVKASLIRSILGMMAYAVWVAAWHLALKRMAGRVLKGVPDLSAR